MEEQSTNNKYYVPQIEDIKVGYELQYHNWGMDELGVKELNFNKWETCILDEGNVETFMKYGIRGGVRVSYLTKEQIEAEGWVFITTNHICNWYKIEFRNWKGEPSDFYKYPIYGMQLIHDLELNKISIYFDFGEDSCVFEGECKSINELRYISKLLNIN